MLFKEETMHLSIFGGEISIRPNVANETGQLRSLAGRIKRGSIFAEIIKSENDVYFIIFRSGNKIYKMDLMWTEKEYLENLLKKDKIPKFVNFINNCLFIRF